MSKAGVDPGLPEEIDQLGHHLGGTVEGRDELVEGIVGQDGFARPVAPGGWTKGVVAHVWTLYATRRGRHASEAMVQLLTAEK